jgi:hypothetical protein
MVARVGRRLAVSLALFGAACASAPAFDGRVFRSGSVAFELREVPAGWRRLEVGSADLASLTFRDDANDSSVFVSARCGVLGDDAPLAALTNHLIAGTTEREYLSEETLPFDGREARHTIVRAKLDGVPMTYSIYVLKKDGCVYDFVRVAPPANFERGAATFERFVAGFHSLGSASS